MTYLLGFPPRGALQNPQGPDRPHGQHPNSPNGPDNQPNFYIRGHPIVKAKFNVLLQLIIQGKKPTFPDVTKGLVEYILNSGVLDVPITQELTLAFGKAKNNTETGLELKVSWFRCPDRLCHLSTTSTSTDHND